MAYCISHLSLLCHNLSIFCPLLKCDGNAIVIIFYCYWSKWIFWMLLLFPTIAKYDKGPQYMNEIAVYYY